MIFHSTRKSVPDHSHPSFANNIIEKVTSFKYLGDILDETLSWSNHLDQLHKKNSPLSGILWRIKHFVPRHVLLKFYYAHIHSHLNYLVAVWGRASISLLSRLQTIQNRCLKTIFKLPFLHPTSQLYSDRSHKALPLSHLCDTQTIMFVFDNLHSNNYLCNLQFTTGLRTHNTRQYNHLLRSRSSTGN